MLLCLLISYLSLEPMFKERCDYTKFQLKNVLLSFCFNWYFCFVVCIINRIRNYSPDLKTSEINEALRKALQIWGDAIPTTFRRVHVGSADIEIRWVLTMNYFNKKVTLKFVLLIFSNFNEIL